MWMEKVGEDNANSPEILRERVVAIFEAMRRYSEVSKPIPLEWVKELKEHVL